MRRRGNRWNAFPMVTSSKISSGSTSSARARSNECSRSTASRGSPRVVNRFRLLIDGPHFGEGIVQRERDRTRAARQVEETPRAAYRRSATQVLDQRIRVGQPKLVVEGRSAAIQVGTERRLIADADQSHAYRRAAAAAALDESAASVNTFGTSRLKRSRNSRSPNPVTT